VFGHRDELNGSFGRRHSEAAENEAKSARPKRAQRTRLQAATPVASRRRGKREAFARGLKRSPRFVA
jgi:hypothetical protein